MWSMSPHGSTDHTDNSMTHFAMLALFEAERLGIRMRPQTWSLALNHWHKTQNEDGSWGWGPNYPGSGSMTCAGIAAILIASGRLGDGDAAVRGDDVIGCGVQSRDPALERAFAWLERGFSVRHNPGTDFWLSYYLYALERAGRMSAQRFIGNHDWFREGTEVLVRSQEFSGAWPPDVEFQKVSDKNVSTSFSLMFLAKGRWPVVMAHLQHRPADDWNRHRGALANLVSHVEQAWGRNLTHQVVDVERAAVEDLLEARRSSSSAAATHRSLPPTTSRNCGCTSTAADSSSPNAAAAEPASTTGSARSLREVFPEQEFQLQLLPPDHPVWFAEKPIDAEHLTPLWGIDVGCRTAIIYCPTDLSAYWELDRLGRERDFSDAVQSKLARPAASGDQRLELRHRPRSRVQEPCLPARRGGA